MRDVEHLHEFIAMQGAAPPDTTRVLEGRCYVCGEAVSFTVQKGQGEREVNWRESVICPGCGLNNRFRSCVHLLESMVNPRADERIYITEAVTPLYRLVSTRYPHLVGSEYREGVEPGSTMDTPYGPVRNEDVTGLSFSDREFRAVLSFDVLEHVPDYRSALREFHRVLAAGGHLMLSAPFMFAGQTRTRARLGRGGEVEHLLEPVYHGDPFSDEGILCFHEFGMDLLEVLKDVGFQDSYIICYQSLEWGYPGEQVMFFGHKGS